MLEIVSSVMNLASFSIFPAQTKKNIFILSCMKSLLFVRYKLSANNFVTSIHTVAHLHVKNSLKSTRNLTATLGSHVSVRSDICNFRDRLHKKQVNLTLV